MAKTYAQLKKQLDKVFSEYSRRLRADEDGIVSCITCSKRRPWNQGIDAGHYISRSYLSTRWDIRNVWPQCKGCNGFGNGMADEYALFLVGEYGDEILWKLNQKKHETVKYGLPKMREMIESYKNKLKEL